MTALATHTTDAIESRRPATGKTLAILFKKDLPTMQKQYRRTYGDTLPIADIADIHIQNVCKMYPEHPLSKTLIADISQTSGQANGQTDTPLFVRKADIADNQTDNQTSGQTEKYAQTIADIEADNKAKREQELKEQKEYYEKTINNLRLEAEKTASKHEDRENKLSDTIKKLQTDADKYRQTATDTTTSKQTLELETYDLRHTIQTLQTSADIHLQTIADKDLTIQTLQTDADTLGQTIQTLQTDIEAARQSFNFKFMQLWNAELETINIFSIGFAFYGFTLLFGVVGFLMASVMSLFLKNTIKNMKNQNAAVVEYGMSRAIGIEIVFGLFHFTTFYNLLKPIEQTLIIPYAGFVALLMAAIFSGLSISSLRQQNNQVQ